MADIISFTSAKKENIKDKVRFLNDILMPEHKMVLKHINQMLIYENTTLEDKSNDQSYIINIQLGQMSSAKINVSKNRLKYNIVLTFYEDIKSGVEVAVTYKKEISGEYEVSKKRKKILSGSKFVETKFTKACFNALGKQDARITYLRDEKSITLIQENQIDKEKKLINIYGYDDKLNLITMLKGFRKDNGYIFYEGFTNNIRVPDDKALFASGIKDILIKRTKFVVRSARLNNLEVITKDEINILNNKDKVINAIKQMPCFEVKQGNSFKEYLDMFEGLKKYTNEFDEDVIIIRLNDGKLYKYTKKNSSIFDVQAEKYKCFYENDFLNPNNIVSEVEILTYPLVPVNEIIVTRADKEKGMIIRNTIEEYEDNYLLLRREKNESDADLEIGTVIIESEFTLETNDSYKKQTFTKRNNYGENYEEYDYLCNPEDDKVGFRFLTREYDDETLKEVFAFGKQKSDNTFASVSSIYMRKNAALSAIILKSEDNENMKPEKVFMDYGKIAGIETQLAGLDYYEYKASKLDDGEKIFVNANNLNKFLDDIEMIEEVMLKDFTVVPKNFTGQMTDELRRELDEEVEKIKIAVKKGNKL